MTLSSSGGIQKGTSGSATIGVTRTGGHVAPLVLSLATNDQGITATGSVVSSASSGALTIVVPAGVPAATYALTITASDGSLSRTLPIDLVVVDVPATGDIIVAKSGGDYTTIQAGLAAASPGETVVVRAGVYNEAITFPRSGSVGAFITLQADSGAIIDGAGKTAPLVSLSGKSYIRIAGFEIRNLSATNTPMGISVKGACNAVEIRNNVIHDIDCQSTNGHGIGVYGDSATAITGLVISGNEVYGCKLGQSESLVVNGNVDGFEISGNRVHDNDNIGIDCIGYEGTAPVNDSARNGRVIGNHVYNISSASNATYGGERSADGIYVDGGQSIVIEGNTVDACDVGIECASEHAGKNTDRITVRSNFVSRSYQANILAGGYDANRGNATNIAILNNTTYGGKGGEMALQYHCTTVSIRNNIFYGKSGQDYLQEWGGSNTGIVVDTNLYFGASGTTPGAWADTHAKFANPLLVNSYLDMHITSASPAINAGIDLGSSGGVPIAGSLDIDGQSRLQGVRIDLGADESR